MRPPFTERPAMARPLTHPRRSHRTTWRRTSVAAVAVLALSPLAACEDDASPAKAGDGSSASADGTESSGSADPTASETPESTDESSAAVSAGESMEPSAFVDLYAAAFEKATTTEISMKFGGALELTATGAADFSKNPPEMQIAMSDPSTGQDMAMVLSEGSMYVQMAPKQFVRYDLDDPTGPLAGVSDQMDPRQLIDTFEKGVSSATYVGTEQVDGEEMERYAVIIDTAAMLEGSDVPEGAAPGEASFDLWFDGDGLFRRMKGDLGAESGTFEATYDNWGEPVSIKTPPKSQIVELPNG